MMRTVTCDSAGRHFPPLRHKLCKSPNIFIVDPECLVGAESTNLAPKHRPSTRSASLVFWPLPIRPPAWLPLYH